MSIVEFTDLMAWQEAHRLCLDVYRITDRFPDREKFGLTSQVRRSAVSVVSNIAEGFGRRSIADKRRFYNMAIGSVYELKAQLLIGKDLGFLLQEQYPEDQLQKTGKLINGLITSVSNWSR